MTCHTVLYKDDTISLEAFVASTASEPSPLVILCHAWRGRDEFICNKALELAQKGYIAFALDMYGQGVLGNTNEENAALKQPFTDDRYFMRRRLLRGFDIALQQPHVNAQQVVVLGYGFGGLCALDLALSGVALKGAISVYGHFELPPEELQAKILAPLLVLHGANDTIVPPREALDFQQEIGKRDVDCQIHLYSNTSHAFVNPHALESALYNAAAAKHVDQAIYTFLDEVFAK